MKSTYSMNEAPTRIARTRASNLVDRKVCRLNQTHASYHKMLCQCQSVNPKCCNQRTPVSDSDCFDGGQGRQLQTIPINLRYRDRKLGSGATFKAVTHWRRINVDRVSIRKGAVLEVVIDQRGGEDHGGLESNRGAVESVGVGLISIETLGVRPPFTNADSYSRLNPDRYALSVADIQESVTLLNQTQALSTPDNLVGGAAMRTIPTASSGLNLPTKGEAMLRRKS